MMTEAAKLRDYSSSNYIPIADGDVILWQVYGYLSHTTNLTAYKQIMDESKNMTDLFPQSHMRKILEIDIRHLETLFESISIHHRNARSLNFLGTGLKIVAGTPDFDDFEKIKFNQAQLIDSNNRQAIINTKSQEQINRLTDTVNSILANTKKQQIDTGHLYEILLARNRILISEIQNLMLSITLAKLKIINPIILEDDDIKSIINEQFTNVSVTELMEVAHVKILQNDNVLHFIIKYPIPKIVCKKIIIYPVAHNGNIIFFDGDDVVAECGSQVLAVEDCNVATTLTFCKELPNKTCAQQLHSGGMAHCNTQPDHRESVLVIDDGIVIINNRNARIREVNGFETDINGTYLLTFDDAVWINGSKFINRNNINKKQPGSATSTLLNITGHREILSLPFLHRMNTDNLRYIGEIETKLTTHPIIACCATLALITVCYTIVKLKQCQNKQRRNAELQKVIMALKKNEDVLHLSEGGVNPIA